mmetsp:Transcript_25493/g.58813  ORF Transcript_25493/g.58813 Transcript_25493/m.58813 type:complete len:693 (-) Transcript_25493:63-2141(-)
MFRALLLIVACFAAPALSVSLSSRAKLTSDAAQGLEERPVMKVVRLLQDMKAELEAELADDTAVHEKLSCWCKENDQEKTTAIEKGEAQSDQLKSSMSEGAANIASLKVKRKATMEEIQADDKALREANELRIKDNKEFHEQETYLLEAIEAAKQALIVLSQHHPEFAQLKQVADLLQKARVTELAVKAGSSVGKSDAFALKDFLRNMQTASSFLSIPGFQSYTPQSGQIFGVLKQMLADFKDDLSASQSAEEKAAADYAGLKAAKQSEIASGKKRVEKLDQDLADADEKYVQEAKMLEDTEAQLDLDREFLASLKQKCKETDEEFEQRVKDRHEEIAAVEETIKILNDDEAFKVFDKTVSTPAVFIQVSDTSSRELKVRQRAVSVLTNAAKLTGAPQLALLAANAKLDAFTKVKAEIDKLVAELSAQQSEEEAHKDWCIDEFAKNERSESEQSDKKENLDVKIASLEKEIASLGTSINETSEAISEMKTQMKRASETREAEYGDFQQTIMDQRLTQTILKKAIVRMSEVYAFLQQEPGAAHIHTSGNHTDAGNGPARFSEYAKHKGGNQVLRMLDTVLTDSQKMEDEAITAEEDAQTVYESFMKAGNKDITAKIESIAHMTTAKAKAEQALVMAKEDLAGTMDELEELSKVLGDLHGSCDFIMKNFDARQEARAKEIDALKETKAILSGMQ